MRRPPAPPAAPPLRRDSPPPAQPASPDIDFMEVAVEPVVAPEAPTIKRKRQAEKKKKKMKHGAVCACVRANCVELFA